MRVRYRGNDDWYSCVKDSLGKTSLHLCTIQIYIVNQNIKLYAGTYLILKNVLVENSQQVFKHFSLNSFERTSLQRHCEDSLKNTGINIQQKQK